MAATGPVDGSAVTVHGCGVAVDEFSVTIADVTSPQRTEHIYRNSNLANAVTGNTQHQVLSGSRVAVNSPNQAVWFTEAINNAAGRGTAINGRGGATPARSVTPPSGAHSNRGGADMDDGWEKNTEEKNVLLLFHRAKLNFVTVMYSILSQTE